jgi:hypothetical protein
MSSLAAGILLGLAATLPSADAWAEDQAPSGFAARVGVVYRDDAGALRLAIARQALVSGSRIAIVTAPDPTVLCCAAVGVVHIPAVDEFDPAYLDGEGKTTYLLDAAGIGADIALGFGIVDDPPGFASGGAKPDLDGDGVPEGFRTCASGEGLHLTLWNGEPLKGVRVWHAYFYLGYDTEADCEEPDYR